MNVDLSIDLSQTAEEIIAFIKETVAKAGFSKVVIGLSGGIDSAVSCTLAVRALSAVNVCPCLFPYETLNKEGQEDAQSIIDMLTIPRESVITIDIKPFVDPIADTDSSMDDLRCGNVMVRMRMLLLFDQAKKRNSLVLGTENKTEHLLGYYTRFGDEASDIEPIIHLYKTQIRQLADYLKLPPKIIDKPPTAGMWKGQTDEDEFGFTYEDADKILYLFVDKKIPKGAIIAMGFSPELVSKVLTRMEKNCFKHELPYHIKK